MNREERHEVKVNMSFKDKQGRLITIEEDYSNNIVASYNGVEIGKIEFDIKEDVYGNHSAALFGMNVEDSYRNSGIATEMMRLAAEIHGKDFSKPSLRAVGGRNASSDSYYTQDGAALISRCIKLGILDDVQDENSREYFDDDFED